MGETPVRLAALLLASTACMMESDSPARRVSREEFGEAWPLTVSGGDLSCRMDQEITFQWKGTEYTLTGRMRHSAYADIERIRATAPDGHGKKDLTPLIRRGRELCR